MKKLTITIMFLCLASISAWCQDARASFLNGENYFERGLYAKAAEHYILAANKLGELHDDYKGVLLYNLIIACVNMASEVKEETIDLTSERLVIAKKWLPEVKPNDMNDQFEPKDIDFLEVHLIDAIGAVANEYTLYYLNKGKTNINYLKKSNNLIQHNCDLAPKLASNYTLKGSNFYYMESYDSANFFLLKGIELYEANISKNPDNSLTIANAYLYYAITLFDAEKGGNKKNREKSLMYLDKGDKALEREWAISDNDHKALNKQAYEEIKKSIEQYKSILQLLDEESADEGLESALKVLETDSTNYLALYTCGTAYLEKDFNKSTGYFLRAIAADSLQPEGYIGMAVAYFALADRQREEAKANNKNYTYAKKKLDQAHANEDKGVTYLEKAHELDPTNKQLLELLVNACAETKNTQKYTRYKAILEKL